MKRLLMIVSGLFTIAVVEALAQNPGVLPKEKAAAPVVKTVQGPPLGVPRPEPRPAAPEKKIVPPEPVMPKAVVEPIAPTRSPGETQAPVEARYYETYLIRDQEQTAAVRRAAEARAEQRTRRLESRRWFGMSNLRPQVNADALGGEYGARWTSNDQWFPERWTGVGNP
jgi:hypothetical protein